MAVQSYSVYFPSVSSYAYTAASSVFEPGATGAWTLELWVYTAGGVFYSHGNGGPYGVAINLYYNGKFVLVQANGSSADVVNLSTTNSYPANRWHHVSVCKDASNVIRIFVNGVQDASTTYTGTIAGGANTRIILNGIYDNNGFGQYGSANRVSNVRWVKGTALYTSNFTPPTGPLSVVTNTRLLTANSPTLVDNSGNNYTITLVGSPTVSTNSPFYTTGIALRNTAIQGYSVALNGTSQYYTVPVTSSLVFGTGDYTVECWIYPTTTTGRMFASGNQLGNYFCFIVEAGKLVTGRIGFAGAEELISTATVPTNTWTHLAGSRQSGTARIFINGNLDKSGAIGTNYATPSVPNYLGSDGGNYTNGYISNLRVIKGQAIYTASFTVPAAPLTAVANTQLLTFNDSVVRDGSSNNLTMTAVGSPPVSSSVTPFGPNFPSRLKFTKVNPSSYSVSFNGSSALSLTGKSLSGANFTIEGWIYFNTFTTNDSPHMFNFGADQNNRYLVWRNSGTGKFNLGAVNTGTYTLTDGATTPVTGSWYHLALVRNGASNYLYVNGVQDATNSAGISSGTNWSIGKNQFDPQVGTHLNGYISNFRVVTGSAVYTSNFNPPSAPLTAIQNTALLTCNDSTIKDGSVNNYTITVSGSAAVNTSIPSSIDGVPKLKIYSVT